MSVKKHPDHIYVEALLKNNSKVLSKIYEKYSPKIVAMVKKNSGNADDAQDIIQETLVTIFHQANEKNFILTCPFDAYFYLLCKRRWLNELKKRGNNRVTIVEEITSITEEQEQQVEETEIYEQQHQLFEKMFKELGQKCQELLKTTFKIKSMEKVAEILGVTYGYARKKKSQCLGQITKLVKNSNEFQQLNSY
ncbi:sigma-70 family RNA polymerase sigma factor [Lutibacter sp. TH_r2]|uniref:RNA polymerase sigma factor n=1 Tax=Lutibacter sp. TH_r2 TaxID=3082083 RepID=UPI002955C400|nr:sigma-70 family RNA polymerase sigma factor [Lutibacter sp. TH_r2]MDV7186804.1 sigma-70 family RNA polymerase sigma factor [Lutibacter sp. TH_r2]